MIKKLLIANWKMHPGSASAAQKMFATLSGIDKPKTLGLVICPPYPFMGVSEASSKNFALGAQDVFWEEGEGPFTGEVSATMLHSLGVEYVIIGHSERRYVLGETDEIVNKKTAAALAAGMKVILCVGETAVVRKKGIKASRKFVSDQLDKALWKITSLKYVVSDLVVAYEPVWAISTSGSGKSDTPEDAAEMINFIREALKKAHPQLQPHVIYGGSVNKEDAVDFVRHETIEGALIGAASLKMEEFKKIIEDVSQVI